MKFEFNTEVDGAKEAAALATALAILHGAAVGEALDAATVSLDPRSTHLVDPKASEGYHFDAIPPQPFAPIKDTDRMNPEDFGTTSAAAAFGADPAPQPPLDGKVGSTLDTAGLPWDARIHAGTKATNKDGTWSRRRNTPDEVFAQVMAELKSGGLAGVSSKPEYVEGPDSAPQTSPITALPPPPPSPNAPAEASGTVVPPPPVTSTPGSSTTSGSITFPQLVIKITKAQTSKKIDAAKVTEFLGTFGFSSIKELGVASPDTIAAVNAMVDEHVGA